MVFLQKFRVTGHSMEPGVVAGQEILVSGIPYFFVKPNIGDLIAFESKNRFIVKRVKEVKGDQVLVGGDNASDSREFGWIEKKRIVGKVIYP